MILSCDPSSEPSSVPISESSLRLLNEYTYMPSPQPGCDPSRKPSYGPKVPSSTK